MRSEARRAWGAVGILVLGSVVTLATSSTNLRFYGGTYDVSSTCAGFQETGVLKAHFYSPGGVPFSIATPASTSTARPKATPGTAPGAKPASSPSPTPTPATSAVDPSDLTEGTAPGAKAFGFPSERFTVESVRAGAIFESTFNGTTCRAMASEINSSTLVFLCRDDATEDILCHIKLKKQTEE